MGLEDIPEISYDELLKRRVITAFERAEITYDNFTLLKYVIGITLNVLCVSTEGKIIDGKLYARKPFQYLDISRIRDYKKIE